MTETPETEKRNDVQYPSRNQLLSSVRRHRARREEGLKESARSFARNLGYIGVLGWLIVGPTLLGIFAGRWLDRLLGTGIFWTGSLLILGLVLGCWSAWKRMQQP